MRSQLAHARLVAAEQIAAFYVGSGAEVVGLDPCARGLTRSRLTAAYRLSADATPELPYPDGYFDGVVVEDLSALQAAGPALAHLRRWLAPGGRLVVVAHNATHEAARFNQALALERLGRREAALAAWRDIADHGALSAGWRDEAARHARALVP